MIDATCFQRSLVLTGPTGSGKSALALDLAERINAEIVAMDAMTLYRGFDIGTAKPTPLERARVPHHLIDVLEPWESGSVAWWLERAAAAVAEIESRGRLALFVGGTPLYLKALMFGLFDGPPADAALRQRLQKEAVELGSQALHERLAKVDPAAAGRLHPNDTRRIIRALEVFERTGTPISEWQRQWRGKDESGRMKDEADKSFGSSFILPPSSFPSVLWLDLPRPVLYDRINGRVNDMFAAGLVDEARALAKFDPPVGREARQALGYKEVFAYLEGRVTLEETITQVQTHSRNFAKRQITWFRHLPGCLPATAQLTEELWQPRMRERMKDEG